MKLLQEQFHRKGARGEVAKHEAKVKSVGLQLLVAAGWPTQCWKWVKTLQRRVNDNSGQEKQAFSLSHTHTDTDPAYTNIVHSSTASYTQDPQETVSCLSFAWEERGSLLLWRSHMDNWNKSICIFCLFFSVLLILHVPIIGRKKRSVFLKLSMTQCLSSICAKGVSDLLVFSHR